MESRLLQVCRRFVLWIMMSFTSSAKLTKDTLKTLFFVWRLGPRHVWVLRFFAQGGPGWALWFEHGQLRCCHQPETLPFPRLKGF